MTNINNKKQKIQTIAKALGYGLMFGPPIALKGLGTKMKTAIPLPGSTLKQMRDGHVTTWGKYSCQNNALREFGCLLFGGGGHQGKLSIPRETR